MLPDPRRYVADASNPLAARALANDSHTELVTRFRDLAVAGRDDRIRAALAGAPAALPYSRLWRALCVALEKPAGDEVVPAYSQYRGWWCAPVVRLQPC